jgi:hypothetical protein
MTKKNKSMPETLSKTRAEEYLVIMREALGKCSSKAKAKYYKGIIAGLEASMGVREEQEEDGFWYVVFDTEDMRDTTDFFETAEEAQAHVHKLIIEEFRSAETIMVIKGHELPLMAGFVND